ncbi:ribosomal protein L34e-domain-containing protein [Mycena rosella]|uniref:Ribosomal protein L34e-domain-containing protein n=1 Tax=Mycena rosella TaxID=1033263 RepID=A0AAD7C6K9_MYCRO|nr:ribosomal protein L34e-domain-containing protein [Mycena rosella]
MSPAHLCMTYTKIWGTFDRLRIIAIVPPVGSIGFVFYTYITASNQFTDSTTNSSHSGTCRAMHTSRSSTAWRPASRLTSSATCTRTRGACSNRKFLSLHVRKRQPYNTTSNRRRVVKTPSGKLVYHHLKKIASSPKCGDCGVGLPGIPALRPYQSATIPKRQKTAPGIRWFAVRRMHEDAVSHALHPSSSCFHNPLSILRAFLVEA